jgi:hypothetical protein
MDNIFSKIDKKVLTIIIILLVILLAIFCFYKYMANQKLDVRSTAGGVNIENIEIEQGGAQIEGGDAGGLTICLDKCGDGLCQKTDPQCQNSLNCICPESNEDCPQDCQ